MKFYHLLQTATSSTVDTEKCSLSPGNSQIFPIFKELIDNAQLITKKSVSDFCIWEQKKKKLSDCNEIKYGIKS